LVIAIANSLVIRFVNRSPKSTERLYTLPFHEIISGCSLVGFKHKLNHHLREGIYISLSFLPNSLAHQVQVTVCTVENA